MNEINPMYNGGTNISYTTNASRQYPIYKVTRTIAQPIVVSREDLIKNLAGASDQYKQAMLDTRDAGTAVGSAVDDKMVEKMLSTPQNKGRLESELPIESALMGGLLKGFQAYNTVSNMKLAQEKENYLSMLKQIEMEDAMRAREEAAAAKNAELNKTMVEETKYTDPVGGTQESAQQSTMYSAAATAINDLYKLAQGGIGGWNNDPKSRWNSKETANLLGKREAALSALIPITNTIAKASGGSGINTLGEMMAYLGIPENATSAQIAGALPGIIRKMPLEVQAQLPFSLEDTQAILKTSDNSSNSSKGGFSMDDVVKVVPQPQQVPTTQQPIPQQSFDYGYSPAPQGFYGNQYSPIPQNLFNKKPIGGFSM